MKKIYPILTIVLQLVWCLNISFAAVDTYGGNMFARYSSCQNKKDENKRDFSEDMLDLVSSMGENSPRGVNGIIGILGGLTDSSGPVYFAGMAALRLGVDEVHVYTSNGDKTIPYVSPDFLMHHHIPNNLKPMLDHMKNMDVIIVGPGLEKVKHSSDVVNEVIRMGKKNKKPLILELDEYFYTEGIFRELANYPEPGVIVMLNSKEFEKVYPLIKIKDGFSDAHINIDFKSLGPNMLIYRKGCVDMAFTKYPADSWSYTNVKFEGNSKVPKLKRSKGQGSVIAGMAAVYFNWALKDTGDTWKDKHMILKASAATYAAANLMRLMNVRSVRNQNEGALTSDMIDIIYYIVHAESDD